MLVRVLIVDDEDLQRRLVRAVIHWPSLGMNVVGEAEDGRQAISLARELWPDILIMDINIPHGNGLEASRKIKMFLPNVQVIILSAFGEFDFARDAICLGVVRFVLKPLDPEELTDALQAARSNLDAIAAKNGEIGSLLRERIQLEQTQFLISQLMQSGCAEIQRSEWGKRGLPLHRYAFVLLLEVNLMWQDDIQKVILDGFSNTVFVSTEQRLYAVISDDDAEQLSLCLQHFLENQAVTEGLCGGVSAVHESLELHAAWDEAQAASQTADRNVQPYEAQSRAEFLSIAAYDPLKLQTLYRAHDWDGSISLIRKIFQRLTEEESGRQAIFYIPMNMLMNLDKCMAETGEYPSAILTNAKRGIEKTGAQVTEICQTLSDAITQLAQWIDNRHPPSTHRKAEEARCYIESNYTSAEIGLDRIASIVGANPSYLSKIFKAEYGCSLTRYLLQVRMEHAREALSVSPEATVTSVAQQVGYIDVYYFSKSFKKFYGILPSTLLERRKRRWLS